MARLVATITVEWRGLDLCTASFQSIGEACANAHFDYSPIEAGKDGFYFQGMKVAIMEIGDWGNPIAAFIKPAPALILFIGWLMNKLPSRASVVWRNGWPHVNCPSNDDRDAEPEPTFPIPPELVLA
jgi:hypothetical protein